MKGRGRGFSLPTSSSRMHMTFTIDLPPFLLLQLPSSTFPFPSDSMDLSTENLSASAVPATHSYCTSFKQFTCDQQGAELSIDDIKVTIPPGAISDRTVHIEMGVAMYGPFKFLENCRPVSPILWFCIKELDVELSLPIEYVLPHTVTDDIDAKLHFAKTSHSKSANACDAVPYIFERLHDTQSQQSHFVRSNPQMKKYGYGHLSTKHCCYLCIEAEVERDQAIKMGYCLHTLINKVDDSHYMIVLLCTYFLDTCIKVTTCLHVLLTCLINE
jgi:hypothetical protein